MKYSEAKKTILCAIAADTPVFAHSPPGIGKSSLLAEIGQELDKPIIDQRAVTMDPTDLRGLPMINGGGRAHWAPPAWLPREEDKPGIIFLDELSNAPLMVQNSALQLVLDRQLGDYRLPARWYICAAGNRVQDRAGSFRLTSSLANRFLHVSLEADAEEWLDWARGAGVHQHVRSFISEFKHKLCIPPSQTETRGVGKESHQEDAYPTPRSWEMVSKLLNVGGEYREVACTVGDGIASDFYAHVKFATEMVPIKEILADPMKARVPGIQKALSVLCMVCEAIIDHLRVEPKDLGRIWSYVNRIHEEHAFVIWTWVLRNMAEHAGRVPQFKAWSAKHQQIVETAARL
jgi:hypothetical protein